MQEIIIKHKNIYQRFIEVQKRVTSVNKNETVKMFENDKGYKAVSHDDVASALHGPLADAGIVMIPDVAAYENTSFEKPNKYGTMVTWYRTDIKIVVKWINADDPNDFFISQGAAFALDTSDKSFAKAYSLALKIVLLKVHLLESRDDEEQRPYDQQNLEPVAKTKPAPPKIQAKKPEPVDAEKEKALEIFYNMVTEYSIENPQDLIKEAIGEAKKSKLMTKAELNKVIALINERFNK